MAKNQEADQVALARRLMGLGCPLDLQFFQQAESSSRSLRIRQFGGVMESRVFDIESHGTGYMLNLEILNGLRRAIYIRGFELELPWQDDLFHWLPDPREGDEEYDVYCFVGERLEFPREIILNHNINRINRFTDCGLLSGLALAQGPEAIPDGHKHGEELHAKFSVIDELNGKHSADVVLYVDRSARLGPKRPKKPRRGLFDRAQPTGQGATISASDGRRHPTEERLKASRTRELSPVGSSATDLRK
jgi:hypothetical protein